MSLRQAAGDALNALETGLGESPAKTRVITALRAALAESVTDAWREFASDYERGVIDGMAKQAESSVDRAVNALAEPKQEPVAVKHMMRWVDALKRLSDDGQHMNIPGLSSGACWELAAELEQFIKSTAPTPRRPLKDETLWEMWVESPSDVLRFARAIERAHGIGDSK